MVNSKVTTDCQVQEEALDAWERFESAVDAVMKAGPQHRKPAEKPKPVVEDRQ